MLEIVVAFFSTSIAHRKIFKFCMFNSSYNVDHVNIDLNSKIAIFVATIAVYKTICIIGCI